MTNSEKEFYMKYCKYNKEAKEVIINLVEQLEKKDKVIDDAINFIQDNCLEEIADMKGCYREIASVGDLQELINILKGVRL